MWFDWFAQEWVPTIDSVCCAFVLALCGWCQQIFDRQGNLQRCFGKLGDACGEFRMPRKIAIGPYDDIVVADKINNRVQVFSSDGAFQCVLCKANNQNGAGGVAVDSSGVACVLHGSDNAVYLL